MASWTLSDGNCSFCLDLLRTLHRSGNDQNVFFSPFSISSALSMVLLGAREETASHMAQCLQVAPCGGGVHGEFGRLLGELNEGDAPFTLSVANRLYGEKSYQFVQDFLDQSRKFYLAELERVDFLQNSDAARVSINDWVETQTQGKIKDLLSPGVVDSLTRLVLVNAIYFKGSWNKRFQESQTRDAPFRITKDESKTVKMMEQKSKFPLTFISEADCQVLELPYVGKQLSMLIILPMKADGLQKVENLLTPQNLLEWTRPDMMDEVEVVVNLPRFKMEEKYDMQSLLSSMGMAVAFDPALSDFSGMSPANDLFLSKVVHQACVEVGEEGTEAAGATAAVMMLRCALRPASFMADHPFLFFIRHNPSKTFLFAGRYCRPQ